MAMFNNQIVRFYKPQKIKQSRKQRRCGACGAAGVMAEVPKPWPPRCPQPLEVRLRPAGSWKIIVTSLKTIGKSRKTIGISWKILEHLGTSSKIIWKIHKDHWCWRTHPFPWVGLGASGRAGAVDRLFVIRSRLGVWWWVGDGTARFGEHLW